MELLSFPKKTPAMEIIIKKFFDTLNIIPYSETIEQLAIDIRFFFLV
jgi:hypothetical protein